MTNDFAPELLKAMRKEFEDEYLKSKKMNAINERLKKKKLTLRDADTYAMELGRLQEKVILRHFANIDPKQYELLSEEIVRPCLKDNYDKIVQKAKEAQELANEKAMLGIKPAVPVFNEDKADGLVQKVKEATDYEGIKQAIEYNIQTFNKGIVSDSTHENADLHYKAGLRPVITRIAVGNCCKWCQEMAGTYDYETVKNPGNDVFRFHSNCKCYIIYDPNNGGRRQNTRTKKYI